MGGGSGGGKAVWRERIKAWKELAKLARSGKIDTPTITGRRSRSAVAQMTYPDLSNLEDQRVL